jgi:hypothetical protein
MTEVTIKNGQSDCHFCHCTLYPTQVTSLDGPFLIAISVILHSTLL